jgi:hypothetical protein
MLIGDNNDDQSKTRRMKSSDYISLSSQKDTELSPDL